MENVSVLLPPQPHTPIVGEILHELSPAVDRLEIRLLQPMDVRLVPPERLITAIAGEDHRHVFPRELRHRKRGKCRTIPKWLSVVPYKFREYMEDCRSHNLGTVLRVHALRRLRRECVFAVVFLIESDGEGLHWLL